LPKGKNNQKRDQIKTEGVHGSALRAKGESSEYGRKTKKKRPPLRNDSLEFLVPLSGSRN
jgi:hypothetical protein